MSLDHAGNYYCINPPTREPESELTLEDRVRYLERRVKDLEKLNPDDVSLVELTQRVTRTESRLGSGAELFADLERDLATSKKRIDAIEIHNSLYVDMDIRLTSRVAVLEKKCT